MGTARNDFPDALSGATSRNELLECLKTRLSDFGIGGYGYGFTAMRTERGTMADMSEIHFYHTYPAGWKLPTSVLDPSTILVLSGRAEVPWNTTDFGAEDISPDLKRQYDVEHKLGMYYGVSLRVGVDNHGRLLSGIGLWLADRPNEAAFRADWERDRAEIRDVLTQFDTVARTTKANLLIGLSPRELDVLSFLAAGYRPAEASWKLKISEKTFEKHVANAKLKLNANTRDHAIAKALVLTLINP